MLLIGWPAPKGKEGKDREGCGSRPRGWAKKRKIALITRRSFSFSFLCFLALAPALVSASPLTLVAPPLLSSMDAETYRRMQLEAVTGHGGTSEQEIIKVTSWLVVAALAWRLLKLKPGRVSTFLIEFGLLILPQIILFCYPQWARWIIASVAVPSLLLAITNDRFGEGSQLVSTANPPRHITPSDSPHVAFLTNTRAAIMIMCVIGILAVDFPSVFPRRFAKTETVGISLMDMGVGCVIVSLGLTAARRHLGATMMGRRDTKESDRSTVNSRSSLSSPSLWAVMRSTLPLLILGVARMLAVKALDYQEHVGEYGLHWNFFMTLGCLPMLLWLFLGLGRMPLRWSFTMGCLLGLAYETILQKTSLATWASLDLNEALKASKLPFWLVANKEGLISLVGYVSLYLMSLGVGSDLITEMGSLGRANWPVCRRVIKKLIFLIISYGVCTRGLDLQPSRRLVRSPVEES